MLQQASQAWGAVCMLAVITLVGRHFGPRGFGGYTLITSFAAAVATVQVAIDSVAVRTLSLAGDAGERRQAFSTVCALYGVLGVLSGVLVAGLGMVVIQLAEPQHRLNGQLRDAVWATALVTAVGWPARSGREAWRADHMFGWVAAAESGAFASVALGVLSLVAAGGPLWTVATVAGSVNVFAGLYTWFTRRLTGAAERFRWGEVTRAELTSLVRSSLRLTAVGLADLLTYSLDPSMLGAFRGPRSVGLYGAAARPPNLLYQLTGSLGLVVMPMAARYHAGGEMQHIHDLLLRGTRYVVAATAPIATALIVMSSPLLRIWLGPRYAAAAPALAIAASTWLFTASAGIIVWNLLAAGMTRTYLRYAWSVTVANLVLSVVLTWKFGLIGVVLGTALPAVAGFAVLTRIEVSAMPVTLHELARYGWRPGGTIAVIVGGLLLALRLAATPMEIGPLIAEVVGSLGLGWLVLWRWFFTVPERTLVKATLRKPLGGG